MKKIIILIIAVLIIVAVAWRFNSNSSSSVVGGVDNNASSTVSVPTSQTVVVSTNMSEYKNDELGFSVKYPTTWERTEAPNNVNFVITVDPKTKNTVGNLQAKIDVISGKCAFPPVTSVKERDTLTVGDLSLNMISIANTVQSRHYFNRMYSLQKGSICYFFTYSSITTSPAAKGLTGADAQKAAANNTTLVDAADTQFKDLVKSFKFVTGPAGQDETTASPKK